MYYIVKIKFDHFIEHDDKVKPATGQFVIDGELFGDVENVATAIMTRTNMEYKTMKGEKVMVNGITNLCNAEFDIVSIARTKYADVIGDVDGLFEHIGVGTAKIYDAEKRPSSKWYKCRIGYDTITDSGKDTIVRRYYLVGAKSVEQARTIVEREAHDKWSTNSFVEAVDETKISGVYILKPIQG